MQLGTLPDINSFNSISATDRKIHHFCIVLAFEYFSVSDRYVLNRVRNILQTISVRSLEYHWKMIGRKINDVHN